MRMVRTWFLLSALLCFGCVDLGCFSKERKTGSGVIVTKIFDLKDFNAISAGHAFKVDVQQGDEYAVTIDIDDNFVEFLKVSAGGDTLQISMDSRYNYKVAKESMNARITMPELVLLNLSCASSARFRGFENQKKLALDFSGASTLHEGSFSAEAVKIELSGASSVKQLKGTGKRLSFDASGASSADLTGMSVKTAAVEVSGASSVTVGACETLSIDASGASHVSYTGDPKLEKVSTSGASSFSKK